MDKLGDAEERNFEEIALCSSEELGSEPLARKLHRSRLASGALRAGPPSASEALPPVRLLGGAPDPNDPRVRQAIRALEAAGQQPTVAAIREWLSSNGHSLEGDAEERHGVKTIASCAGASEARGFAAGEAISEAGRPQPQPPKNQRRRRDRFGRFVAASAPQGTEFERALIASGHRQAGGRPRITAPWFEEVAKRMADGTPLRRALMWARVQLPEEEIKRLYSLREFRRLYRLERRLYQQDKWGRVEPTEAERLRKRLEKQIF